jgi:polyisoprenoid-binding protein YceI
MTTHLRPLFLSALFAAMAWGSAQGAAPAAQAYTLDPAGSWMKFAFTQAKAENTGKFRTFDVQLRFADAALASSKLDVTIKVAALDTGDDERDTALRGADLFNVAKFPEAKFHATKINRVAAGRYEALGRLTIRDVSKTIMVPFSFRTATEKSGPAAYMTGRAVINRLDFGVGQGDFKATDQVANEVSVTFGLRLVPAAAAAAPAKP